MTLFHGLGPISSSLASGDLQFITSATGSAAASISVSGCFSAAYDHYLVLKNWSASGAGWADVRLRSGSTDDTGANYRRQQFYAAGTSLGGVRSTANTSWDSFAGYSETTSIGLWQMWISNPFAAVRTTAWVNTGAAVTSASIEFDSFVGEHDLASSYDGLTVIPKSGTISGTVYVYGMKV